ncbi:hypothetical protein GGR54DRAFT_597189 [Hypoxylon sp. NC1633]|nr:hypothetical protein GGR54DRAFT_597189 [Hypoxylon sp. NC1633]
MAAFISVALTMEAPSASPAYLLQVVAIAFVRSVTVPVFELVKKGLRYGKRIQLRHVSDFGESRALVRRRRSIFGDFTTETLRKVAGSDWTRCPDCAKSSNWQRRGVLCSLVRPLHRPPSPESHEYHVVRTGAVVYITSRSYTLEFLWCWIVILLGWVACLQKITN